MSDPIVVEHLTKHFEGKTAVSDVSFSLRPAEFLAVVGPSGCGKTTTLRMLAGLESVSSGEIRINGVKVNEIRPKDRNIAMVFQDYAIFPHLTVYENIAYGLRSRHVPNIVIRERVPEAARTFRIEHLLGRKPRQLSGGERQRVALARAVVREAELYLYDEPLSNLDAQLRHSAREDILALHRKFLRPSIYVTHDQSEAMALGDRIAVMRGGKLEQIGTPDELYSQPRNKFVAFFIGTPSINLFEVRLEAENLEWFAVHPAFRLRLPPRIVRKVGAYNAKKVIMGIRPEDFSTPKTAAFPVDEHNTVQGIVNVIEPMATGSTVYLSTAAQPAVDFAASFKVRLPAQYLGKTIPLAIHVEKLLLFDADTEESLLHGREEAHYAVSG